MVARGTFFWDYGNCFLKAVFDAGAREVAANSQDTGDGFISPFIRRAYHGTALFLIQDTVPFACGYASSGKPEDLRKTDQAALECIDPTRNSMEHRRS